MDTNKPPVGERLRDVSIDKLCTREFRSGLYLENGNDLVYQASDFQFIKWMRKYKPSYFPQKSIITTFDRYQEIVSLKIEGIVLEKENIDVFAQFLERMGELEDWLVKESNTSDDLPLY